jgi:hypothetical protein
MFTKKKSKTAPSRWVFLIGTIVSEFTNRRDQPRPPVAPFMESDENGMRDDELNGATKIAYPPEIPGEEDDVMMDFVSGR